MARHGMSLKSENTKCLYLIRHAQGTHNVAAGEKAITPQNTEHPEYETKLAEAEAINAARQKVYESQEHFDAHLSEYGAQRARLLREKTDHLPYELVVVSPLYRTLQTATLGLDTNRHVPWFVNDHIREFAHGAVHPCDGRTCKEQVIQDPNFQNVGSNGMDWSSVASGEDTHGSETEEELHTRCQLFIDWLSVRPEKHIAVVSHSAWLKYFCEHFVKEFWGTGPNSSTTRFANRELKGAIVICSEPSSPCQNDFHSDCSRHWSLMAVAVRSAAMLQCESHLDISDKDGPH